MGEEKKKELREAKMATVREERRKGGNTK